MSQNVNALPIFACFLNARIRGRVQVPAIRTRLDGLGAGSTVPRGSPDTHRHTLRAVRNAGVAVIVISEATFYRIRCFCAGTTVKVSVGRTRHLREDVQAALGRRVPHVVLLADRRIHERNETFSVPVRPGGTAVQISSDTGFAVPGIARLAADRIVEGAAANSVPEL